MEPEGSPVRENPMFCIPPVVEVTVAVIVLVTEEFWETCLSPSEETEKENACALSVVRRDDKTNVKRNTDKKAKLSLFLCMRLF